MPRASQRIAGSSTSAVPVAGFHGSGSAGTREAANSGAAVVQKPDSASKQKSVDGAAAKQTGGSEKASVPQSQVKRAEVGETEGTTETMDRPPSAKTDSEEKPVEVRKKRDYDKWIQIEEENFFASLKAHPAGALPDFGKIAKRVSTKNYEQVRCYYYRLIKKINKVIEPIGALVDTKNITEVHNVLLSWWGMADKVGYSLSFKKLANRPVKKRQLANGLKWSLEQHRKRAERLLKEKVTAQEQTAAATSEPGKECKDPAAKSKGVKSAKAKDGKGGGDSKAVGAGQRDPDSKEAAKDSKEASKDSKDTKEGARDTAKSTKDVKENKGNKDAPATANSKRPKVKAGTQAKEKGVQAAAPQEAAGGRGAAEPQQISAQQRRQRLMQRFILQEQQRKKEELDQQVSAPEPRNNPEEKELSPFKLQRREKEVQNATDVANNGEASSKREQASGEVGKGNAATVLDEAHNAQPAGTSYPQPGSPPLPPRQLAYETRLQARHYAKPMSPNDKTCPDNMLEAAQTTSTAEQQADDQPDHAQMSQPADAQVEHDMQMGMRRVDGAGLDDPVTGDASEQPSWQTLGSMQSAAASQTSSASMPWEDHTPAPARVLARSAAPSSAAPPTLSAGSMGAPTMPARAPEFPASRAVTRASGLGHALDAAPAPVCHALQPQHSAAPVTSLHTPALSHEQQKPGGVTPAGVPAQKLAQQQCRTMACAAPPTQEHQPLHHSAVVPISAQQAVHEVHQACSNAQALTQEYHPHQIMPETLPGYVEPFAASAEGRVDTLATSVEVVVQHDGSSSAAGPACQQPPRTLPQHLPHNVPTSVAPRTCQPMGQQQQQQSHEQCRASTPSTPADQLGPPQYQPPADQLAPQQYQPPADQLAPQQYQPPADQLAPQQYQPPADQLAPQQYQPPADQLAPQQYQPQQHHVVASAGAHSHQASPHHLHQPQQHHIPGSAGTPCQLLPTPHRPRHTATSAAAPTCRLPPQQQQRVAIGTAAPGGQGHIHEQQQQSQDMCARDESVVKQAVSSTVAGSMPGTHTVPHQQRQKRAASDPQRPAAKRARSDKQASTEGPPKRVTLQLVPLDERTREVVAGSGHNPHLELTFRPQKAAKAILQHLSTKWCTPNSPAAAVEQMGGLLHLYGPDAAHGTATPRWGMHHCSDPSNLITAYDICQDQHKCAGAQPFRLRYAWVFLSPDSASTVPPQHLPGVVGAGWARLAPSCEAPSPHMLPPPSRPASAPPPAASPRPASCPAPALARPALPRPTSAPPPIPSPASTASLKGTHDTSKAHPWAAKAAGDAMLAAPANTLSDEEQPGSTATHNGPLPWAAVFGDNDKSNLTGLEMTANSLDALLLGIPSNEPSDVQAQVAAGGPEAPNDARPVPEGPPHLLPRRASKEPPFNHKASSGGGGSHGRIQNELSDMGMFGAALDDLGSPLPTMALLSHSEVKRLQCAEGKGAGTAVAPDSGLMELMKSFPSLHSLDEFPLDPLAPSQPPPTPTKHHPTLPHAGPAPLHLIDGDSQPGLDQPGLDPSFLVGLTTLMGFGGDSLPDLDKAVNKSNALPAGSESKAFFGELDMTAPFRSLFPRDTAGGENRSEDTANMHCVPDTSCPGTMQVNMPTGDGNKSTPTVIANLCRGPAASTQPPSQVTVGSFADALLVPDLIRDDQGTTETSKAQHVLQKVPERGPGLLHQPKRQKILQSRTGSFFR